MTKFITKIHIFPELLEHLTIHALHSNQLVERYTLECPPLPPYKTGYGFILGGVPLNPHNRINVVEVPSRQANFDKIRQITIVDDLPGGGGRVPPPHNMEKYKIQKENTSKRLSSRSKNPGGEWDTPHPQ